MIYRSSLTPRIHLAVGRALALAVPVLLVGGVAAAEARFEKALVYLERNVADDDVEVRFAATASDGGFAALRVIAPDGRTVIDFRSPDSRLGFRHLDLESPEPRNDGSVQADFPQGKYRFEGTLVGGGTLQTEATLSHALPEPPTLSSPRPEQNDVPVKGAKVRWAAVANAVSCVVVLEEKGGARELRATLPGSSIAFAVPDGFLQAGAEYKVAVGAVLQGGNRSFVEVDFSTTKRR